MGRARIALEKIEDMLERCVITSKRCTRLLHIGKERYGNRDEVSFPVSSPYTLLGILALVKSRLC